VHKAHRHTGNSDEISKMDFIITGEAAACGLPADGGFAILTRADSNTSDNDLAELSAGDAFIVRKADGRASDEAIDSLVLSHKLLGTKNWIVIHYIGDDEAPLFDSAAVGELLERSRFVGNVAAETISSRPLPGQSTEEWNAAWINFWQAASRNLGHVAQTVRADIDRIRNHPRTPADVEVQGFIRDTKLGSFSRV
jgi:carbonic anhydrase